MLPCIKFAWKKKWRTIKSRRVGKLKRMNSPLGIIKTKELCVRYLEGASFRSIQNATQHEPTDPVLSDCLGHKFYKTSCNIHTRKTLLMTKSAVLAPNTEITSSGYNPVYYQFLTFKIHLCTKERECELQRCCQRLI